MEKKIIKVGTSCGVILDSKILYKAEIKLGDIVVIESSQGKITITKGETENDSQQERN